LSIVLCLLFSLLGLQACKPAGDDDVVVASDTGGGGGGGTADTTAPTISITVPANGATNIAVGNNLTVTFSEAMQSSTINTTNVTLTNSGAGVTSAVSYSSNVATINPNSDLNANTTCVINVGAGVRDTAGNAATPCADSSQANDVFIYLNMSPTSVGP
jgi:hypothetical protein